MASTTANLGLVLPDYTDNADVAVINANMQTIDGAVKTLQDRTTAVEGSVSSLTSTVGGKVSKSGDTMTGDLTVAMARAAHASVKSTSYKTDTSSNNGVSSAVTLGQYTVYGSDGNYVSNDYTEFTAGSGNDAAGSVVRRFGVRNMKTSGDYVTNWLSVGVKKDGTRYYGVTDQAAFRTALGLGTLATKNSITASDITGGALDSLLPKQPTSNDLPSTANTSSVWPIVLGNSFANNGKISYCSNMASFRTVIGVPSTSEAALLSAANRFANNSQYIKMTTVDSSKSNNDVSSSVARGWQVLDKNERFVSYMETTANTDGSVQLSLVARNFGTGSNVNNGIYIKVANNGTREVTFSDASVWRTGMGANNASNLTTGTVPYARLSNSSWAFGWGSSVSGNYCRYRKVGHICYVEAGTGSGYSTGAGTTYTLCTLPSGYRPSAEITNALYNYGETVGEIFVATGGAVKIRCTDGTSWWWGCICFPVA